MHQRSLPVFAFSTESGNRRIKRRSKADDWLDFLQSSRFVAISEKSLPWLACAAAVLIGAGFLLSVKGEMHRVSQLGMLYVPAVWLATLLLLTTAFWSALGLVLGRSFPLLVAQAVVPTGAMFSFLALWSGAMWSRAYHGDWLLADARQGAILLLFLFYLAMMSVRFLFEQAGRGDRLTAVLSLLGVSLVPMLFFGLEWRAAVGGDQAGSALVIDAQLQLAMLLVTAGLWLYTTCVGLLRLRCLLVERQFGLAGAVFLH